MTATKAISHTQRNNNRTGQLTATDSNRRKTKQWNDQKREMSTGLESDGETARETAGEAAG